MRWVPGSQAIVMHGMTIIRGMAYVGVGAAKDEPSLINPALPIGGHHDNTAESLQCWPTYADMSPAARRCYLEWLVDGARAPIDIGYVFLYFYGLERRLLIDQATAGPEEPELIAEIDRLASIFGASNHRFQYYSRGLLDYIQLRYHGDTISEAVPNVTEFLSYELPIAFRFGLGRFARDQEEIPVDWAFRWALTDRLIQRQTSVKRCRGVFERAFAQVYAHHGGAEMMLHHISQINSPLSVTYDAASPALRLTQFHFELQEIPDVTEADAARGYLQWLVAETTGLIGAYSRFVGRNPDKADTLQAYLMLPYSHWPATIRDQFSEFRASNVERMEPLTSADLFAQFGRSEPTTPQMVVDLANGLQRVGVGMEPEVLAGARRPGPNDSVVLFSLQDEIERGSRDASFQTASAIFTLASCLALADTDASVAGLEVIERRTTAWTHFCPDQQTRLRSQYRLGLHQRASLSSLKIKLRALAQEQRLDVIHALAQLAKDDGVISPKKVKFFEQLYGLFEFDPQLVCGHLYSTSKGPARIERIDLDRERIGELKRETELVSALLGDVFIEEESDLATAAEAMTKVACSSPSERADCAPPPLLSGLTPSHNAFLILLLTQPEWSRAELEAAAGELQIMLDGAMESINEAALDTLGAMLFDGYDPIYIERELLENPAI